MSSGLLGKVHHESKGDLFDAIAYCNAHKNTSTKRSIAALEHAANVWRTAHVGDGLDPERNLRWGIVRGRVECRELSQASDAA